MTEDDDPVTRGQRYIDHVLLLELVVGQVQQYANGLTASTVPVVREVADDLLALIGKAAL